MTDEEKLEKDLDETYKHYMDYFHDDVELKRTCECCEKWMGRNHDYSECRENQCFRNYLALKCLEWSIAFAGKRR